MNHPSQITTNALEIPVTQMQFALTLLDHLNANARLAILEMDLSVSVCNEIYYYFMCIIFGPCSTVKVAPYCFLKSEKCFNLYSAKNS